MLVSQLPESAHPVFGRLDGCWVSAGKVRDKRCCLNLLSVVVAVERAREFFEARPWFRNFDLTVEVVEGMVFLGEGVGQRG